MGFTGPLLTSTTARRIWVDCAAPYKRLAGLAGLFEGGHELLKDLCRLGSVNLQTRKGVREGREGERYARHSMWSEGRLESFGGQELERKANKPTCTFFFSSRSSFFFKTVDFLRGLVRPREKA